jgi:dihydrofolate reductase
MNSLPKVVFSRTLASADWNNTQLIKEATVAEINNLKRAGNKNTFVFGSANLCATLMQHNLFDEYRLAVAPIVLGTGKPLFPPNASQLKLKLLDSRTLSNGCVIVRYAPISNR